MSIPFKRRNALLAACVLLLSAAGVGKLVAGWTTTSPLLATVTLPATPWSAALDQQTGRLFVVSRSSGAAGSTGGYAFPSAGSYTLIGGNVSVIYKSGLAQGQNSVSILDAAGGALVRTVPLGRDPANAVVNPQQDRVYVTSEDDDTLSVLDAGRARLLATIRVGTRP